jgi:hypothetical protein
MYESNSEVCKVVRTVERVKCNATEERVRFCIESQRRSYRLILVP